MVTMSFGDHIEELRVRLILALIGLFVGVLIVFVPPLNIGWRVMKKMEEPAKIALADFYQAEYQKKAAEAERDTPVSENVQALLEADAFVSDSGKVAPDLNLPNAESLKGKTISLPLRFMSADMIKRIDSWTVKIDQSLISLAPLEVLYDLLHGLPRLRAGACEPVGLLPDLGHSSPPGSIGMNGTTSRNTCRSRWDCFWRVCFCASCSSCPSRCSSCCSSTCGCVAPTLRLTDWMGFATILPLVFGISFQTPLVMLFLERINIFTVQDFRAKRRMAILVITITAAVITPGQDPFSMVLLAIPMILLYELGILMIKSGHRKPLPVD